MLKATILSLCLTACWGRQACPVPIKPVTPPPRIVQLKPPPCSIPDRPALADPVSLKLIMLTGGDIVIQMSQDDWREMVRKETDWQSLWEKAQRCEVP